MTDNGSRLFVHHSELLEARAVAADVIDERGYVSADTQAGLRRWGFSASQAEVARDGSVLVVPVHDVLGERAAVQMRPDHPRAQKGRTLKYETAAGSTMVLDVPFRVRPLIGDPGRPLVITEGPIKADALVSAGLHAMALLGVWNWRGTNDAGGKVVLAAFEHIALNGRQVYVCFDSDVMLKAGVHEAMARFAAVLGLRGAEVAYIYLPHGDAGAKVGVDDFLAAEHSTDELLALASPELRAAPTGVAAGTTDTYDDVPDEPGWSVLDDIVTLLRRFVVFANDHQPVAVALWVMHTHALDAADTSPRLAVTSAEKRSGKSRLLEVQELVCRNAERSVNVSIPYLFRSIELERPTVLFDEIDTIFGAKVDAAHEELRGIVNAGHRRGATVGRMVGEGAAMVPKRFDVFCPVALAGIGQLPETIVDRSINIELRRRSPDQLVDPFRFRRVADEAAKIQRRTAAWAQRHMDRLTEADPTMPSGVIDRLEECWAPLVAIADAAGGDWWTRAREACKGLAAIDQEQSIGVRLLADCRTAFGAAERIASADLADKLVRDEEAPWGDWNGKPVDARWLARRLKRYDIKPGSHKFPGDVTLRGYLRSAFEDAWSRYLPPECNEYNECNAPARDVADVADVADRGGDQKPADDTPWSDHSYDREHDW